MGLGIVAALVSWGIALFEYLLQVPANRIGHEVMALGQLKVLQEINTLSVFVPFAIFYMKEKLTLAYLWAGLFLLAAAYFIFRKDLTGSLVPYRQATQAPVDFLELGHFQFDCRETQSPDF